MPLITLVFQYICATVAGRDICHGGLGALVLRHNFRRFICSVCMQSCYSISSIALVYEICLQKQCETPWTESVVLTVTVVHYVAGYHDWKKWKRDFFWSMKWSPPPKSLAHKLPKVQYLTPVEFRFPYNWAPWTHVKTLILNISPNSPPLIIGQISHYRPARGTGHGFLPAIPV